MYIVVKGLFFYVDFDFRMRNILLVIFFLEEGF